MKEIINFISNHLVLFCFLWFASMFLNGFIKAWTEDWLNKRKFNRIMKEASRKLKPTESFDKDAFKEFNDKSYERSKTFKKVNTPITPKNNH